MFFTKRKGRRTDLTFGPHPLAPSPYLKERGKYLPWYFSKGNVINLMDSENRYQLYKWRKSIFTKKLRRRMTPMESVLWEMLRNRRFRRLKFRRQVNIGPFIADFLCKEYKVIIELDGSIHNEVDQKEYDLHRDEFLTKRGYNVLRFKNEDIQNDIQNTLRIIDNFIQQTKQKQFPLLRKGEG